MSYSSDAVKRWRKNFKARVVQAFGSKCGICGYSKFNGSLDLHHIDPKNKEFSIGQVMAHPIAWEKVVPELRKCVCVCSNCHGEIHAGITKIPAGIPRFDENYIAARHVVEAEERERNNWNLCPVCGSRKPRSLTTCSRKCVGRSSWRVNWEVVDLEEELRNKTKTQLAKELGCSDSAIRKRLRKLSPAP